MVKPLNGYAKLLCMVSGCLVLPMCATSADSPVGCQMTTESIAALEKWYDGKLDLQSVGVACQTGGAIGEVVGGVAGGVFGYAVGAGTVEVISRGLFGSEASPDFRELGGNIGMALFGSGGMEVGKAVGSAVAVNLFSSKQSAARAPSRHEVIQECADLLELSANGLSQSAIKSNFRRMSLKYHPDKPGGSQKSFEKIGWCKEVLLLHMEKTG